MKYDEVAMDEDVVVLIEEMTEIIGAYYEAQHHDDYYGEIHYGTALTLMKIAELRRIRHELDFIGQKLEGIEHRCG